MPIILEEPQEANVERCVWGEGGKMAKGREEEEMRMRKGGGDSTHLESESE